MHRVNKEVNDVFEDLKAQDEIIHNIITEVSDITSARPPSFSDVHEWKNKTTKKVKELDEDLEAFTGVGNKNDVKSIMNQIETAMDNARTSEGEARFADFRGASQMKELAELQDYNDAHKSETASKIDEENIDELSMSEIKESNVAESKSLKDKAGDILNAAFNDLKKGNIDRETYLNVLNGIKQFDKDAKEGYEDIGISRALNDYLYDESEDAYDASGKMAKYGIAVGTFLKAYDLHGEGFKIEKYKTHGKKMIRYRVHGPEAYGLNKSKNRDTKIYDKHHMEKELKKGKSGQKIPITDKVKSWEGAKSGLKTKAGWLGVALDVGLDTKNNINDGASTQRIVGDAGVDIGVGTASLMAAGAASAFAVGTFGAPVLAGAAIGIGVSYGISTVAEWNIGGKSVEDHIKDGVQGTVNGVKSGVKTVAGWFN